jgi:hypothetical protein
MKTDSNTVGETTPPSISQGEYLCSETALYHVEYVGPGRVLLEDCRTSTLLDIPIADTVRLRHVTPAPSAS